MAEDRILLFGRAGSTRSYCYFGSRSATSGDPAEIQKPKDLQGKRLGAASVGGTQGITTKSGLEYLGLDEERHTIRVLPDLGSISAARSA